MAESVGEVVFVVMRIVAAKLQLLVCLTCGARVYGLHQAIDNCRPGSCGVDLKPVVVDQDLNRGVRDTAFIVADQPIQQVDGLAADHLGILMHSGEIDGAFDREGQMDELDVFRDAHSSLNQPAMDKSVLDENDLGPVGKIPIQKLNSGQFQLGFLEY